MTWRLAGGLVLALASACALNWSYYVQHGAAASLPPLLLRRPFRSLAALFGNRRWLVGFWTGIGGWVLYVVALTLAPLSRAYARAESGSRLRHRSQDSSFSRSRSRAPCALRSTQACATRQPGCSPPPQLRR